MDAESKTARKPKRPRAGGTHCIWPRGVEIRFGISACTRWRWETASPTRLPKRDVFINGRAVGWKPETLDQADGGEQIRPSTADECRSAQPEERT
jgi:hypothetical protein